jgi:HAD superfamily hydrolase (TIGR01509 family)
MDDMLKSGHQLRRETVLFDLDGVIVSSEVQKSEAHVQTVLQLGGTASQKLDELYSEIIGLPYEDTRDRFLECANIIGSPEINQEYQEIYKSIYRNKLEDVRLASGAERLLQTISDLKYRIGLVSSEHSDEITTILKNNQIDKFFAVIVSGSLVKKHKPDPEPYIKALELLDLGQAPDHAIVFEDTQAGIVAAKAANLKVFAVRHRLNQKQIFIGVDRVFNSLADEQVIPVIEHYLNL